MSEVNNSNISGTSNNGSVQSSEQNTDVASTGNSGSGALGLGNGNLTISVLEATEESDDTDSSDGVESPQSSSQSSETEESEEVAETEESDETEETEEEVGTTALEDIAFALGNVFMNSVLAAAGSSSMNLDPTAAVLNRFKKADDAEDAGEPDFSSGLADGKLSSDFGLDIDKWSTPADGLTESFAASAARLNQGSNNGGSSASVASLLGYELFKA